LSPSTMPAASATAGLEPAPLWRFFEDLSAIPRPSKDEGR
jgi:hypothetical protein